MRGDGYQRAAVVVRHQLDPGGQCAVGVQLRDRLLDQGQHIVGVIGAIHHHDGRGDIVLVVAAGYAQPRDVPDLDISDILHLDRDPVYLCEHDILDVVDPIPLGQIFVAAVVYQADATDIDRLLAHRDLATADVDVGVAQRRDQLGNGQVVGFELVRIDIDVELLGRAAPTVDLDDPVHCEQTAQRDPVLYRSQ